MIQKSSAREVKSVRNGFRIIDILQNYDGAGLDELEQQLDLAKSTVHNYLATLESMGYVVEQNGTYHLGLRFLTHGMAAKSRLRIHEAIVEPGEFSVRIRAYDAANGSAYESGIAEGFSSLLVPFDSDLTRASDGFYPNADAAGDVVYEESTTDLGAIQDSIGTDLRLEDYDLKATKQGSFGGTIRSADWEANPRPGQVEVRAAWSRDSISVGAVMTGVNYGRDRTIYTQKIPLEVRIAIVSGSLADAMQSGATVPFSRIQEAAAQR